MNKPDYSRYTLEDLLFDDDFRQWLVQPEGDRADYWWEVVRSYPHLVPLMEQARRLIPAMRVQTNEMPQASHDRIRQVLEKAALRKMAAPMPLMEPAAPDRVVRLRPRRLWSWGVAAAVTVLLLAVGWGYERFRNGTDVIRTAFGETRTVNLPDGSVVKLNGNSVLTYHRSWEEGRTREVWLEGEGFFVVSRQQSAEGRVKFVTHTPHLDISVLGTRFNVNTRRGQTAVTLVEGKIQLTQHRTKQQRIIELRPGQQARLTENKPSVEVATVRTDLHDAWTRDLFVFDNTPLRDIATMLYDTYGLQVVFPDDELAEKRFTGNLSRQNVETLLEVIAATYGLEVVNSDGQVELIRK